jgi:hypothetical protein
MPIVAVESAEPEDFWRWTGIALSRHFGKLIAMGMDKQDAEREWDSFMNGMDTMPIRVVKAWEKKVLENKNVFNQHR